MTLRQLTDMSECIYFTRRVIKKEKIKVWVFRELCPKCNLGLMGKPRDPKTGKPQIRAKEYICPKCNHIIEQKEYEDSLTANIEYTCSQCGYEGETQVSFKRKKLKIFNDEDQTTKTAEGLRFSCAKCSKSIDITKKMK